MKTWAKEFYLSASWQQVRKSYLMSQDYICERCGNPAKVVHHKKYLTEKTINIPEMSLGHDNLEALCQDCHNKEHHGRKKNLRYRIADDGTILPP